MLATLVLNNSVLCIGYFPHLKMVRHKNRYIVFTINQRDGNPKDELILNATSIYNAVVAKVQQLYGDFGVAAIRAGFTTKYCNEKTRVAIVRVRHGPDKLVASALPCVTSVENKVVQLNILYTGATIKHCFKFLLKYQEEKFNEYCVNLNDEERLKLKEAIMNLDAVMEIV